MNGDKDLFLYYLELLRLKVFCMKLNKTVYYSRFAYGIKSDCKQSMNLTSKNYDIDHYRLNLVFQHDNIFEPCGAFFTGNICPQNQKMIVKVDISFVSFCQDISFLILFFITNFKRFMFYDYYHKLMKNFLSWQQLETN